GEGGRGVAVDDDARGALGLEDLGDPLHHLRELPRRRAGAHIEVDVRLGEGELVEEPARHLPIVVLASGDDDLMERGAKDAGRRRKLDELRARADDRHQFHHGQYGYVARGAEAGRAKITRW